MIIAYTQTGNAGRLNTFKFYFYERQSAREASDLNISPKKIKHYLVLKCFPQNTPKVNT